MLSKEDFGKYLKQLRNNKKISLREVNRLTDISYTHLNMIENGKRNVTPALLRNLSDLYGVDYLDLYEKAGYIDLIEDEKKTKYRIDEVGNPVVSIPILGEVKAGYNHLAQETWVGTIDIKSDVLTGNKDEYFALDVKGDSMAGAFLEGDTVIVHKQSDCENNDFAIVIINGDEGTLKMVKKTSFGIILQPLNPAYEPIAFTNEEIEKIPVQIAGVVVRLERDLRKFKK